MHSEVKPSLVETHAKIEENPGILVLQKDLVAADLADTSVEGKRSHESRYVG